MAADSFIKKISKGIREKIASFSKNPYKEVNINWFRLKYYKHLPAGKLRTHKIFGGNFYFVNASELLHGLEEIFIDKIYKQQLTDRPYIIDCGANVGMSVLYMKKLYPNAEIVAFEPDEQNFELLKTNVGSFGLDKVTLRKEAVWIENTELKFSNEGSMGSKIDENNTENFKIVKAIRLKDFLTRKVDFLKIDIEGAEFNVLMDLGEQLKIVNNLFVEYHGNFNQNIELTKLFTLFTENGFSYYIKEATTVYNTPFSRIKNPVIPYDVQLNIFCFRV